MGLKKLADCLFNVGLATLGAAVFIGVSRGLRLQICLFGGYIDLIHDIIIIYIIAATLMWTIGIGINVHADDVCTYCNPFCRYV